MKHKEQKILNTICKVFDKDPIHFYESPQGKRSKESTFLRHVVSYILFTYEGYRYVDLIYLLKKSNNGSIRNGHINIENWLEVDKVFEKKFNRCLHILGYYNDNKKILSDMVNIINDATQKLTELGELIKNVNNETL